MSIYSNAAFDDEFVSPQQRSDWRAQDADRPVREIQGVCSKHNLHCGSPEDLDSFLRALGSNKLLAMNFWSSVARLGDGKHGRALSPAEVLAAIVQGVTGQPLDEARTSREALVDKLTRLLAGEDVDLSDGNSSTTRTAAEPAVLAEKPATRTAAELRDTWEVTSAKASAWRDPHTEQQRATRTAQDLQPDARHETAAPPTSKNRQPAESPRQSSSHRWSGLLFESAPETESGSEAPVNPTPDRGPRLVLQPESDASPAKNPDARRSEAPMPFTPLSGYAAADDKEKPRRLLAGTVLVLVLGAGAWRFFSHGYTAWQEPGNTAREGITAFGQRSAAAFSRVSDSVRAGFSSARNSWHGQIDLPQTTANNPAAPPATSSSKAGQSTAGPKAASRTPSVLATQPARAPASSRRDESRTTAELETRAAHRADANAPIAGGEENTRGGEMVVVPGALMRDRLLSSRVPILPDGIASRRDSFVVVHAVVTSRGVVRDVHAVAGRPELRQPAVDAVSAWHYRPYLLNGSPVDVATTITVNFDGND